MVFEDYEVVIFGAILMLIMIFLPQGIVGGLADLWARRRGAATPTDPPGAGPAPRDLTPAPDPVSQDAA